MEYIQGDEGRLQLIFFAVPQQPVHPAVKQKSAGTAQSGYSDLWILIELMEGIRMQL